MNQQDLRKKKLLEALAQMPIVQYACHRAGIGRATYYRWLNEDQAFAVLAIEMQGRGVDFINDLAVSKVIEGIKNGDIRYVMYWLNNQHADYRNYKIERMREQADADQLKMRQEYEELESKIREFLDDPELRPQRLEEGRTDSVDESSNDDTLVS